MNTTTLESDLSFHLAEREVRSVSTHRPAARLSLLLGLPFHSLTLPEALRDCEDAMNGSEPLYMVTPNFNFVARGHHNPEVKKLLMGAHRIFCDGTPLVWLSKWFKVPLPGRVAGSDLTPALLELCQQRGHSVFILGSDPETMKTLEEKLPALYPGLKLVGAIAPPYGEIDSWDNEAYLRQIREAKPSLLLVALGFPKQEKWITRFQQAAGVPLALGIGASLDFIAGKVRRSPKILQKLGLEWTWRILMEPGRLAKRYFLDGITISGLILRHALSLRGRQPAVERRPLLNGVPCARYAWEFEQVHADPRQTCQRLAESADPAVILDCSSLQDASSPHLATVATVARVCEAQGKTLALFNAPDAMRRYLSAFRLEHTFPAFDSPLTLEAWVNAREESHWALSAPGNLTTERVVRFHSTVSDFVERLPASARVSIGLRHVQSVNVQGAMGLLHLKQTFGQAGIPAQFTDANHTVADTFEILNLREEFHASPGR